MKLTLVNPQITVRQRYGIDIGDIAGHQMPLGIYYIAAFLNKNGFISDVIDAERDNLDHQNIISKLKKLNSDIIGVTSTTPAINNTIRLCRYIKRFYPEKKIIIGGPHVSALPVETMKEEVFDIGVIGEGELTILELMRALREKKALDGIEGIVYKNGQDLHVNKPRPYIKDLDILPPPLRYDFRHRKYFPPLGSFRYTPVYNIITSRGCPYSCVFCDKSVFGSRYRAHSPEYVVSEIEELVVRCKAREIAILDDDFILDKDRIYNILDLLRKKRIRVKWSCMCRPDIDNIELLKYMRERGCWHISVGIESANQKILDSIGKKTSTGDIKTFVKVTKKMGFRIKGFLVLGIPGEDKRSIEETISFVKKININDITATIATPLPGSRLYHEGRHFGVINNCDWDMYTCWETVFIPSGLSSDLIYKSQYRLYKEFYTNPRVIFGHITNIRSLYILKKYTYTLLKTVPSLWKAKYRRKKKTR